jgi:hypothetical protein
MDSWVLGQISFWVTVKEVRSQSQSLSIFLGTNEEVPSHTLILTDLSATLFIDTGQTSSSG